MLERNLKITSFDVYPNSTVKPSALQRHMQQLAREDCDERGCTYPFMRGLNTVFVITKLGMELYRPIYEGEEITFRTYNNSVAGITFDREFEFLSDGKEIGRCTSLWVLVHYDTRALVRPRDFPFEFEQTKFDCRIIDVPRSIPHEGAEPCGNRIVRLSDLDENNHLNNCVYPDIALDSLDVFDGLVKYVSGYSIIFRHESRRGDVLELSARQDANGASVFAHNATSGNACFESAFTFAEI